MANTKLFDLCSAILATLAADWPGDAEPLPERQYVSNGMIVWDCDQLVVMVEATYGTEADLAAEGIFSQASAGFGLRAATIGVAVLRCVPDVDDEGTPPSWESIQDSSEIILSDAETVLSVLLAAQQAGELATCQALAFDRWTSEGPQGGLAGGVTRLRALML